MSRFPFRAPEKLSLEGLQSEFSGLIERWWHRGFSTGPLDGQDWAPPMELRDEPDLYRVTVELPGIDRSAIQGRTRARCPTGSRPFVRPHLSSCTPPASASAGRRVVICGLL